MYESKKKNRNNMSYWLPKIKEAGFLIPETYIHPLPDYWTAWLMGDFYKEEGRKKFNEYLEGVLTSSPMRKILEEKGSLFMKTGNFSNKFNFKNAYITKVAGVGDKFLEILYGSMMVGCAVSPEVVFREFIHTSCERPSIYNGLKLNTEFRVFYDFDKKEVLGIVNYWDRKYMEKGLRYDLNDLKAYQSVVDDLMNEIDKEVLQKICEEKLQKVDMYGIWSIDFLLGDEGFWLIDMAIGLNSAYYETVKEKADELPDKNFVPILSNLFGDGLYAVRINGGKPKALWEADNAILYATYRMYCLDDIELVEVSPYGDAPKWSFDKDRLMEAAYCTLANSVREDPLVFSEEHKEPPVMVDQYNMEDCKKWIMKNYGGSRDLDKLYEDVSRHNRSCSISNESLIFYFLARYIEEAEEMGLDLNEIFSIEPCEMKELCNTIFCHKTLGF